jgi:hypothetical protein
MGTRVSGRFGPPPTTHVDLPTLARPQAVDAAGYELSDADLAMLAGEVVGGGEGVGEGDGMKVESGENEVEEEEEEVGEAEEEEVDEEEVEEPEEGEADDGAADASADASASASVDADAEAQPGTETPPEEMEIDEPEPVPGKQPLLTLAERCVPLNLLVIADSQPHSAILIHANAASSPEPPPSENILPSICSRPQPTAPAPSRP